MKESLGNYNEQNCHTHVEKSWVNMTRVKRLNKFSIDQTMTRTNLYQISIFSALGPRPPIFFPSTEIFIYTSFLSQLSVFITKIHCPKLLREYI